MNQKNLPTIPTVFFPPNTTKEEIRKGMQQFNSSSALILKRGLGEAMNSVFKIDRSNNKQMATEIFQIIQKNQFNGAYWILQPWIAELQHGEMKMYFINGNFLQGFLMNVKQIGEGVPSNTQEIRNDSEMWTNLDIPSVIKFGEKVYVELVKKAPSLAVVFRLDVFRNSTGELVINELEYFGNMWLSLQHTTLAEEKLKQMADAIYEHLETF